MILMVKDRATEYIIDSLEFVKVEYLYYLTKDGKVYKIKAGDLVEFPKGLSCRWKVIKPVRKHYNFK